MNENMTKDELQQIIKVCLGDLIYETMPESEVVLIIGFIENLKRQVHDKDQSDQFAEMLKEMLEEIQRRKNRE